MDERIINVKELIPVAPEFKEWGAKEYALREECYILVQFQPRAISRFKEVG